MNDRFATQPFKLSRGVHQGDPFSPHLFILVLETLAINIRNDTKIGVKIDNQELKLVIFTDETRNLLISFPILYTFGV